MLRWDKDSYGYKFRSIDSRQWLCNSDIYFAKVLWYHLGGDRTNIETAKKEVLNVITSKYDFPRRMHKIFTFVMDEKNATYIAREIPQNFLVSNEFIGNMVKDTNESLIFDRHKLTISNPSDIGFESVSRAVFKTTEMNQDKYYCLALPSYSKQAFKASIFQKSIFRVRAKRVKRANGTLLDLKKISNLDVKILNPETSREVSFDAKSFCNIEDVKKLIQSETQSKAPLYVKYQNTIYMIHHIFFANIEAFTKRLEDVIQQDKHVKADKKKEQKTLSEFKFLDVFAFLSENSRQKIRRLLRRAVFLDTEMKPKAICWRHEYFPESIKSVIC